MFPEYMLGYVPTYVCTYTEYSFIQRDQQKENTFPCIPMTPLVVSSITLLTARVKKKKATRPRKSSQVCPDGAASFIHSYLPRVYPRRSETPATYSTLLTPSFRKQKVEERDI
jgi:hypothetical protein